MASTLRTLPALVVSLFFLPVVLLRAQSCLEQVRDRARSHVSASVSVAELRFPREALDHYQKARDAFDAKRRDVFERETHAALAAAPTFAAVYVLRAFVEFREEHYEAVLATIATARSVQPELPYASVVLASALTQLHRYDEAAEELDRFHSLNQNWQWEFERTRVELARKHVEEALQWSERTIEDAPSACTATHLLRINALQLAGRRPEAIAEMKNYLAASAHPPREQEVLNLLARVSASLGANTDGLVASR